jgi:hypothetical protein
MTRPGTLYRIWRGERQEYIVAMFIRVEKQGSGRWPHYYHYFLDDRGKIFSLVADTEVLEEDNFLGSPSECKRINL